MASPLLQVASEEIQSFILANEDVDERTLVLKNKVIHGVSAALIAGQIAGRRKAQVKLPSYYRTPGIVYPPAVSLEQCSSEPAARFKSRIISAMLSGKIQSTSLRGADLTGGFGVDSLFLSRICSQFDVVEPNEELIELAQHNHRLLGSTNIHYHTRTAESFLLSANTFDFIFVDPSRRNGSGKIIRLAECLPSVPGLLDILFKNAQRILLKTSPLLDIQQGSGELRHVKSIYVVAVDNECKEVLFDCLRGEVDEPSVHCVHLSSKLSEVDEVVDLFSFTFAEEREAVSVFSDPLAYLYEPSVAILKAGAFKLAGSRHGLFKLHANTHLYTADRVMKKFDGRIFKIEAVNPDPKALKSMLPNGKANVFVRNYPLSVESLKKKLKVNDGGKTYLIGCSGVKGKFLVVATRVQ